VCAKQTKKGETNVSDKTLKVIGRDRKGNPVLRMGRAKGFYKGKEADGRHVFATRGKYDWAGKGGIVVNEVRIPEEEFQEFQKQMDGAQTVREEQWKVQATNRAKIKSFKDGLRANLKLLRKQYPDAFRNDDYEGPFRKMRLELFEQNKMRVILTRADGGQINFSFTFSNISKEEAAHYTYAILDRGTVRPKSPDDIEVVDLDSPENSATLCKSVCRGMIIVVSSSLKEVQS
jgi:hypothetical protein